MIVPISNGRAVTPIYFPQPVKSFNYYDVPQHSEYTNSTPTPTPITWICLGVILIFITISVAYFIKLIKDLLEDENE